jgi:hypothetical protein
LTDDIPSKRCSNSQCPKPNPQPVTAFSRNRRARDGLQNECKTCAAVRGAAWRKREPSYLREYHAANRERLLEQQKQHREDHIDEARARQRQHYADNREQFLEYQERYRAELAAIVFNHYGWQCACPGCSSTDLCVDHVNGDGPQHRTELYGHPTRYYTTTFYLWLIDNGFPDGFQTLCRPCNSSKRTGTHCRMHHNG